jgi:hypothetical protein
MEERLAQSPSYVEAYLRELESEDEPEFDGAEDPRNFSYELRDAMAPMLREELLDGGLTDGQFNGLVEGLEYSRGNTAGWGCRSKECQEMNFA